jgi:hypothetical protein
MPEPTEAALSRLLEPLRIDCAAQSVRGGRDHWIVGGRVTA